MTNCIKPPGWIVTSEGYHNVACKMRNCPVCSKVLRNQLMDRVREFFADDDLRFMTLTMQADDKSNIMHHWNTLLLDIKRHYRGIRGFLVKEYTKRGVAHIHALVTRFIDQAWLSRRWHEITGTSFIVHMEEAFEVKNAAAYMLKYMTKAHGALDLYAKGERIFSFFGARAPAKKLLGFEEAPKEFVMGQHYNPESRYWLDYIDNKGRECEGWYTEMQRKIGPAFIDYMERMTITQKKQNDDVRNTELTWWLEQRANDKQKELSYKEKLMKYLGEDEPWNVRNRADTEFVEDPENLEWYNMMRKKKFREAAILRVFAFKTKEEIKHLDERKPGYKLASKVCYMYFAELFDSIGKPLFCGSLHTVPAWTPLLTSAKKLIESAFDR